MGNLISIIGIKKKVSKYKVYEVSLNDIKNITKDNYKDNFDLGEVLEIVPIFRNFSIKNSVKSYKNVLFNGKSIKICENRPSVPYLISINEKYSNNNKSIDQLLKTRNLYNDCNIVLTQKQIQNNETILGRIIDKGFLIKKEKYEIKKFRLLFTFLSIGSSYITYKYYNKE